jgi:hypothetical protein
MAESVVDFYKAGKVDQVVSTVCSKERAENARYVPASLKSPTGPSAIPRLSQGAMTIVSDSFFL